MGAHLQRLSQYANIRLFFCMISLVGCDEKFEPQVYRVDPSPSAIGYKALAIEKKELKAAIETFLTVE